MDCIQPPAHSVPAPGLAVCSDNIVIAQLNSSMESPRLNAVVESAALLHEHFSWCRLPYTAEDNSRFIEEAAHQAVEKKAFYMAVLHRHTHRYLGEVGTDAIAADGSSMNIVYWVRQSEQKKGYATGALQLFLGVIIRYLPVQYAAINMEPSNEASRRIAENIGAFYSHTRTGIVISNGRITDALCFRYPLR